YFLKSAELNMTEGTGQRVWVLLLAVGTFILAAAYRKLWPLALLCLPVPFYVLSIAYGGAPIYVPEWWPSARYNIRYGIELLPAFAVFAAVICYCLFERIRETKWRAFAGVTIAGLIALNYFMVWQAQPIGYREAWINSR